MKYLKALKQNPDILAKIEKEILIQEGLTKPVTESKKK